MTWHERNRGRLKQYRDENKERISLYRNSPEMQQYHKEKTRMWQHENRERLRMLQALSERNTYQRRKKMIMDVLGDKCSNPTCCVPGGMADIRCLQFDHINGGGVKEYKALRSSGGIIFYYSNHLDEAKQKLQLLCANCNWIKRHERNENTPRKY